MCALTSLFPPPNARRSSAHKRRQRQRARRGAPSRRALTPPRPPAPSSLFVFCVSFHPFILQNTCPPPSLLLVFPPVSLARTFFASPTLGTPHFCTRSLARLPPPALPRPGVFIVHSSVAGRSFDPPPPLPVCNSPTFLFGSRAKRERGGRGAACVCSRSLSLSLSLSLFCNG